ncbi:hypothetical protein EW146_g9408 [Bondarzewia mesenterica]|uniref:Uncharacterized protein n=1 Tax=Bondarzewia mesenterica TaxID=1095465 RepID=A0A4S4L8I8_9AGAM|nr:hypothetical protein EW146_g9408 [Bondarzewia mesenterica]
MMILGGYHISIPTARALNRVLGVQDADFEDHRMHWPIYDWLFDNGMVYVLVASHVWPDTSRGVPCVFFFTQFHEWRSDLQLPLKEGRDDLRVKDWLEKKDTMNVECGTLEDRYNITSLEPDHS